MISPCVIERDLPAVRHGEEIHAGTDALQTAAARNGNFNIIGFQDVCQLCIHNIIHCDCLLFLPTEGEVLVDQRARLAVDGRSVRRDPVRRDLDRSAALQALQGVGHRHQQSVTADAAAKDHLRRKDAEALRQLRYGDALAVDAQAVSAKAVGRSTAESRRDAVACREG